MTWDLGLGPGTGTETGTWPWEWDLGLGSGTEAWDWDWDLGQGLGPRTPGTWDLELVTWELWTWTWNLKVMHKKFGDILLIFRCFTTESKFYIYITVRKKM